MEVIIYNFKIGYQANQQKQQYIYGKKDIHIYKDMIYIICMIV